MNEQKVVSLLTENPSGVLARVTTLFCRHGVAIEGLTVSATGRSGVSRITVTTHAAAQRLAQLALQARRLVDILQVSVLEGDGVWRELLAVKVAGRETDALRTLALAHGARLLPAADGNAVLELTGTPAQLDAFLECLSGCGVLEFSRTGVAAPELNVMRCCG